MPSLLTEIRRILLDLNTYEKELLQAFGSFDLEDILKQHEAEKQQQLAIIKQQTINERGIVRTGRSTTEINEQMLTAQAIVKFRRNSNYNGEYGFDWMRTDNDKHNNRQTAYADICGYYDYSNNIKEPIFKQDAECYKQLEAEYYTLEVAWLKDENYYIPWLSIAECKTIQLNLELYIVEEPRSLRLEYNKDYFNIIPDIITDTAKGKRTLKDAITVQCIKAFSEDQAIIVRDENNQIAGQLLVWHNLPKRKIKVSWVLVRLDKKDIEKLKDKINIDELNQWLNTQGFNQALLKAEIELECKVLDLIAIYKKVQEQYMTIRRGIKIENDSSRFEKDGEYILWPTAFTEYLNEQFNIQYPDYNDNLVYFFVNVEAKKIKYNPETEQYIIIEDELGSALSIGGNRIVIYKTGIIKNVINHEGLHCLGLYHSFGDSKETDQYKKHIFERNQTENLMDYIQDEYSRDRRQTLWKWQWGIIVNDSKVIIE